MSPRVVLSTRYPEPGKAKAPLARRVTAGFDPVLLPKLADRDPPEDLARWPGLSPA